MALKLHPNNRRKIIRALEVFRKHGSKMTEILKLQHEEMGCSHALSGPLRFPNTCCIWVNANQDVLDDRINNRTEDMISRGLLQELTGFHDNYNKQRLQENKAPDYTHGIFQSIGFKEFHQYLILSEDEKNSERGRLLFKEGKEQLQLVTRRYARKQKKWITNRFLKRPGEAPPVFAVDSTYPDQWEKDAQKPAFSVVEAFLKGEDYPIEPLPRGDNSANQPEHNVCEACEKVFLTKQQWADHTKSRKHQKRLAKWKHNRNKADSNEHTNKTDNSDGDSVNELNKNDTIAGPS
ncbi:unnamed protein product [Owenia fusiformis]|nr:unnamed protein product [Owenia fusiformis]